MFARRPKTPDAIRAEIARLTRRRDRHLIAAPKTLAAQRAVAPVMLVVALWMLVMVLRGPNHPWPAVLFLVLFNGVLACVSYQAWRPGSPPGDLWSTSDRVDYEGDSPRDLQRRIDALKDDLDARG